ncbi:hypothetical protein MNBD_GAMMA16-590 [hydrothermal vent metagenome]|uniref:DUF4381 domain-containing protein n=1 Tax=hydrothermal vent metagenome TaxID=652676 RepID=A0A3B0ZHV7_9ZZZZ
MNETIPFNILADIEFPNEPSWYSEIILAVIASSLLLSLIVWRIMKRKPLRQTQLETISSEQVLNDIIAQYQSTRINQREAAFRIATVLRLSLKLPQLTLQAPDILQHEHALWRETIQQLEQLRYQHNCDALLSPELTQQVRRWIVLHGANHDSF